MAGARWPAIWLCFPGMGLCEWRRHCLPSPLICMREVGRSQLGAYSGSACTLLLVPWTAVSLCTERVMAYVDPCLREWACNLIFCLWSFLTCLKLGSEEIGNQITSLAVTGGRGALMPLRSLGLHCMMEIHCEVPVSKRLMYFCKLEITKKKIDCEVYLH